MISLSLVLRGGLLAAAASALVATACSTDDSTSTSTKSGADAGNDGTATSASDAGNADGGTCSLALGSSTGCPGTTAAEASYQAILTSCGLSNAEIQESDAGATVTDAAKRKLCASCDCRTAVYGYRTLYAQCTTDDQGNATFSANLFAVASTCP